MPRSSIAGAMRDHCGLEQARVMAIGVEIGGQQDGLRGEAGRPSSVPSRKTPPGPAPRRWRWSPRRARRSPVGEARLSCCRRARFPPVPAAHRPRRAGHAVGDSAAIRPTHRKRPCPGGQSGAACGSWRERATTLRPGTNALCVQSLCEGLAGQGDSGILDAGQRYAMAPPRPRQNASIA